MKYTHFGVLFGDSRAGGQTPTVNLRETKNFWVSEGGTKYRKDTGRVPGIDWPMWTLDVSTVKPITKEAGVPATYVDKPEGTTNE